MTATVSPSRMSDLFRMLAEIADKFPENVDASPMFRVFFDQILNQCSLQEQLIVAAKIIEKVDDDSLKFVNAMTVKEAEKRGITQKEVPTKSG